jgi:hypothetical protein
MDVFVYVAVYTAGMDVFVYVAVYTAGMDVFSFCFECCAWSG